MASPSSMEKMPAIARRQNLGMVFLLDNSTAPFPQRSNLLYRKRKEVARQTLWR
jgi:hypothetical protein